MDCKGAFVKETTVAMTTLGCKANQYDASFLAARLKERKFRLVDFKEKADIYVINTCTVTDKADLDSRNLIRRAHRRNPEAFKIVTGCYAQVKPGEVAQIEGVDLVLGNDKKSRLLDYLEAGRPEQTRIAVDNIFLQTELETFGMASYTRNTRAFVKVQDGCNQFCSFCIIPYARGRNRSISIPKIIEELHRLREEGFSEAVLTGIHLGTYGLDQDQPSNLLQLLEAIEKAKPIHRVRVSSVDPEEISDAMIELWANSQVLCPHLHIPLQSGDDSILQMMKRRYRSADFRAVCEKLALKIPKVCIGTDVIVGFPYENEERFQNTYRLLQESPVSYFHVFPFSPKRGTPAAKMLGQVSHQEKKRYADLLRNLSEQKSRAYRSQFVGARAEVLLEGEPQSEPGSTLQRWMGFSEHYLPLSLRLKTGQRGQLLTCTITAQEGGELVAQADS